MHLELLNLLIWKQFKKMTSDSVWEKARKNWNKVHCSCAGDRRGLRHCPAWIMARSCQPSREAQGQQVICADSSEQAVAGVSAPCLQEERGWKERRGSTEDMLQLPHRLKWENKMACLMKCVCPKFPVVLNWLLVLLCLKAKEEFAETLSAMLQVLLPPSWLFAFAVEGNESRRS